MSDDVFGRYVATLHQVAAKTLEYLQLLGCGTSGFEVSDEANPDSGLVPALLLYVTSVQLSFPASSEVDFCVLGFSGAVGNYEMVGESVLHASGLVHIVHVHGIIDVCGAVMDDDFLPLPRGGTNTAQCLETLGVQ